MMIPCLKSLVDTLDFGRGGAENYEAENYGAKGYGEGFF